MSASLKTIGLKRVNKRISNAIKQGRFASAVALTRTAYHVSQDIKAEAVKDLDRPTPFTLRGFRYEKATKKKLQSSVYVAPIQAKYLNLQIEGGRRQARAKLGEAVPVKGGIRLNRYGNIPSRHRGKMRALMARDDTFVGTIKGAYGLWQRKGKARKVKLMAALESSVKYSPRFSFYSSSVSLFDKQYKKQFDKAYKQAMASGR